MGDAPSLTQFSLEIDRNCENESPGTFLTFSFGTDVSQMSAVRFAEENGKNQCGDEMPYPLVFGTKLDTKSVFGNAVLDENYRFFIFFFFNPLEYVLTAISQILVLIGYD